MPSVELIKSADYAAVSSFDAMSPVLGSMADGVVLRPGFVSTLPEVQNVSLLVASEIPEATASQFSGMALYDDQTSAHLYGAELQWAVISGDALSINQSGLATAYAVYRDETVRVSGLFLNVTGMSDVKVLNVDYDNYGGFAGDGLQDLWQVRSGLAPELARPDADPDNDGLINLFEYAFNSDPRQSSSGILPIGTLSADERFFAVQFRRNRQAPELEYVVERSLDLQLESWSPTDLVIDTIVPVDLETELVTVLSVLPIEQYSHQFLRVKIVLPKTKE